MPSPNDFVYIQIYKGALSAGASERHAEALRVIVEMKEELEAFRDIGHGMYIPDEVSEL